ncbi:MAG: RNA polymerase sigma factor [Bacteroidia bacterium]
MMEDCKLARLVRSGDRDAFRLLINRNQRLVNHIVYKAVGDAFEREEICQDVFLKVYRNIGKFKGDAKLSTWIGRIAYHQALDYRKRKKLNTVSLQKDEEDNFNYEPAATESADEISHKQDFNAMLESQLLKLAPHYRTVLTLYHLDEMSYQEIGDIMKMPEGTVKSYLFRARKMLRENITASFSKEDIGI